MKRRTLLAVLGALGVPGLTATALATENLLPSPAYRLKFPLDHGSHPGFGTEWWYLTGLLDDSTNRTRGFQITFFRRHVPAADLDPSAFAPRQLLFAHAALSDPAVGHVLTDARAARAGFGLAEARVNDTDVHIGDWSLQRDAATGRFTASIPAAGFTLELSFDPTQDVLLEGDAGYSRKGPKPGEASAYYSLPQLRTRGVIVEGSARRSVQGRAWLDREWSSSYLDPGARGWDWAGLNFSDGSALMAFVIRAVDGRPFWSGANLRHPDGHVERFQNADVAFDATGRWTSPRSGTVYPVRQTLTVGVNRWRLEPLMDDQEIDTRASTGTRYWEGAVRAVSSPSPGGTSALDGAGYLELTGYDLPLKL